MIEIQSPLPESDVETPRSGAEVLLQIVNSLGDLCQIGAHALQTREAEVAWLEERIVAARSERAELAAFTEGLQKLTDYLNDHLPLLEEGSEPGPTPDLSEVQKAYEAAKSHAEELSQELEMTVFERDSLFEELQERSKALAALEKQARAWAVDALEQDVLEDEDHDETKAHDVAPADAQSTIQVLPGNADAAAVADPESILWSDLLAEDDNTPDAPLASVHPIEAFADERGDEQNAPTEDERAKPTQVPELASLDLEELELDVADEKNAAEGHAHVPHETTLVPHDIDAIAYHQVDEGSETAQLPAEVETIDIETFAHDLEEEMSENEDEANETARLPAGVETIDIEALVRELNGEEIVADESTSTTTVMPTAKDVGMAPLEIEALARELNEEDEEVDVGANAVQIPAPIAPAPLLLDDLDLEPPAQDDEAPHDANAVKLILLPRDTRVQALPALLEGKAFSEYEMRIASILSRRPHSIDEIGEHLGVGQAEAETRIQALVHKGWVELLSEES